MKSKHLKTFENYKLNYLNDNFFNEFGKEFEEEDNMDYIQDVDNQEANEVEVGIEVKDRDSNVNDEDVNDEKSEIENKSDILPTDMPVSSGFNPNDNFSTFPKAEWCIIKCMTNNGERLGIDKECETDCEVVCGGLHYDDAIAKVEEFARKCNCQAFDNECDIYLGKVSKHFIKKPTKTSGGFDGSGSYK
jgi:hypothetical protein